MKKILILLILALGVAAAEADLVMTANAAIGMNWKVIVKIKGDKVRCDIFINNNGNADYSRIADLAIGQSFLLDHAAKRITNLLILLGKTNAINKLELPKYQATGKTELVSGFEAEIYKQTNSDGMIQTLWVATNYPNFSQIKPDLLKLDESNDETVVPKFSSLSGMPLKYLSARSNDATNGSDMILLISTKEEPINDSIFALPKDYHFNPSPAVGSNSPAAPINSVAPQRMPASLLVQAGFWDYISLTKVAWLRLIQSKIRNCWHKQFRL